MGAKPVCRLLFVLKNKHSPCPQLTDLIWDCVNRQYGTPEEEDFNSSIIL